MAPTIVTTGTAVGRKSQVMTCPSCHAQIATKISGTATGKTHLIAALLCLCGCWPCVLIPYCTNSCRNVEHHCPNCDAYIGVCVY